MGIRLDSGKLITIYGGAGFVGSYVVRELAKTGARLRIAVRRPELAGHLQPLGAVGQIHAVQANIRSAESVKAAARGADAVINLVGILAESGRQTFKAVHVDGARHIAEAARAADIDTFVHLSAIGADPASTSDYGRSKAAGEAALREVMPGAVILRPSLIFGPEDQFFNRFAALARLSPVLPLIGGGHCRLQPIYVGDVARAVMAGLRGEARGGEPYELGGPEVLTLRQIFERVLRYTQRRRLLVPVPFALAKLQAALLQLLPNAPLTLDQVRMLQADNVVSEAARREERTIEGLGIDPVAIELIVPIYLQRFRPRGQFASYRL